MVDDTKQRLLDAAGIIFAEKGYEAASIRDICQRADANIAAVHYHFGDKHSLYVTAVRHAQCCWDADQPTCDWPTGMPAVERLREYIRSMIERRLSSQRPHWHLELMLRELARPTEACQAVVDDYIRPMADELRSILKDLIGDEALKEKGNLIGFSIVGQVLFYYVHQPIIRLLIGEEAYQQLTVEKLAGHVADFSLAALGFAPTLIPLQSRIRTGTAS